MKEILFNELRNAINGIVLKDESLKSHTYFKIGGSADLFIEPESIKDLQKVIIILTKNNYNFYIIGNGTNLLVCDEGYRGAIIKIGEKFNYIEIKDTNVKAGAGVLLSTISKETAKKGLSGLEFASGIPGYLGGAVAMNAGAYGGEIKDILTKVKCIDYNGIIYEYNNEEMNFRYRNSRIKDDNLIVLEAEMELHKNDKEIINERIKELTKVRTEKQPLNYPSAGSTFKRPVGGYASKLIDDAGLRGLRYGDAMVSEKHCGFVVNVGGATCEDVLQLMRVIRKTVNDKFGIMLEPEVKIIGTEL